MQELGFPSISSEIEIQASMIQCTLVCPYPAMFTEDPRPVSDS